ncbi:hypothetical protein SXCC_01553 [Gluconacetobacter sp. SXCC-1]|nr:hypothetical protein [Komagataeibacter rhaeticus]EGG78159.1 hypothetical protein SXCC_01553 [Gluconacetobacter sp. SXCC-1]WPP21222.1 hypothetical protein SCD25_12480 [Komagataeibacter rhaeticus]
MAWMRIILSCLFMLLGVAACYFAIGMITDAGRFISDAHPW